MNDGWTLDIKKKIEKFIEQSENENTTHQNLWDRMKAVLRGTLIVVHASEISEINNLKIYLRFLEKVKQAKS